MHWPLALAVPKKKDSKNSSETASAEHFCTSGM
jgi:hypothetical protein